MIEYKENSWWRIDDISFFTRDHPNWLIKHPCGPVHFDYLCKYCNFMIENVSSHISDESIFEQMKKHRSEIHII